MKKYLKYILSFSVVALAVILILVSYWDYMTNPWTRDGRVRANVVQLTTRVSGPIVKMNVQNSQLVNAGDILFEIDPRTYQVAYDQAKAQLEQVGGNIEGLEKQIMGIKASIRGAEASVRQAKSSIAQTESQIVNTKSDYDREKELLSRNATSQKSMQLAQTNYDIAVQQNLAAKAGLNQATANLDKARASLAQAEAGLVAIGESNPQFKSAMAAFRQAELNLEFTKIVAPVDGYITNLGVQLGSNAVANQPIVALVDINSFWVAGYFKETSLRNISSGQKSVVTLMSHPNLPLQGYVESIEWGIAQKDGSTGADLLPSISPTFEWIRLAQRVPVHIKLTVVPEEVALRIGTTASVLVSTDETVDLETISPAPRLLQ